MATAIVKDQWTGYDDPKDYPTKTERWVDNLLWWADYELRDRLRWDRRKAPTLDELEGSQDGNL